MTKPRGRKVPCPNWWVIEARRLLGIREMDLKDLSAALVRSGRQISEMMVIRCLHKVETKRVGTIEAIEAISDYLGMPSCVAIAENAVEALAIRGALALVRSDSDRLKIASTPGRPRSKT